MSVFIAAQDHDLLQRNRLDSFDALWALQLDAVDEPNTERVAGAASTASTWATPPTT